MQDLLLACRTRAGACVWLCFWRAAMVRPRIRARGGVGACERAPASAFSPAAAPRALSCFRRSPGPPPPPAEQRRLMSHKRTASAAEGRPAEGPGGGGGEGALGRPTCLTAPREDRSFPPLPPALSPASMSGNARGGGDGSRQWVSSRALGIGPKTRNCGGAGPAAAPGRARPTPPACSWSRLPRPHAGRLRSIFTCVPVLTRRRRLRRRRPCTPFSRCPQAARPRRPAPPAAPTPRPTGS